MEVVNKDYKNLSKSNIQLIIGIIDKIKDYADVSDWNILTLLDSDGGIDEDGNPYFYEYKGLEVYIEGFSNIEIKIIKKFSEDFPILEYKDKERDCVFYLPEDFYELYKDYKEFLVELLEKEGDERKKLFGSPIFNKDTSEIIWGDIKIFIRPNTNQSDACRVLFSKKIGEEVSWDEIWEEISGGEDVFVKGCNIKVKDALIAVNKKVKFQTGEKIFRTGNKSHTRLF